ncbi:MAG: hypothetical protein WDO14_05735 [Bacteroidota bacterium]
MFSNYFKTFVRSLLRFKAYSIINIFGLTLGITTALFIALWVIDEVQFDRSYPDSDRIFEVMNNRLYSDGRIETMYSTQGLIAPELIRNTLRSKRQRVPIGQERYCFEAATRR